MLDLEGLRALRAVCETGGFTKAADSLNLTQSTISHQIRKLEQRVGRKLIERTTRRVNPSVEGELLLIDARKILDQIAETESRLMSETAYGEVRLGVPEEFASNTLPGVVTRFRSIHPGVRLAIFVGLSRNLHQKLTAAELDLVVLKEAPARRSALSTSSLVWAGREQLVNRKILPLALYPEPCEFRSEALNELERAAKRYEIVMTSTSSASLLAVALEGFALTILPQSECPEVIYLNARRSGLPRLPQMGYRLLTRKHPRKADLELRDLLASKI